MYNIKKTRPMRPDKTIFLVMTGAFFVFFSLPAFYWANYNYGESRRTADFVREMREKPAANLTPNDKKELDSRNFPWQNFCGVIEQTTFNQRTQRRYLWREELAFENGETVWIIPNRVKNYNEISAFLRALPRAVLKEVK